MPDDILPPARPQRAMVIKNLVPSLPERGKIKIGIKGEMRRSKGGTEFQPPQKLDHFVVTTLDRGRDNNYLLDTTFHAQHGASPTEIEIRLLYDDPALNFPTRYACYIGRTLWCSGDGEYAVRMSQEPGQPTTRPHEVQCPCFRQAPGYAGRDKCKMNGSLSVLIEGAGGIGGVWKFRTTSYNSIVGIMSSMAFLRSVTGGPLAGLPLKLTLRPKQAQNPTDGSAVTIYVVNLEFNGDVPQLQAAAHEVALGRAKMQVSIANIEEEARRVLMIEGPANAVLPGDTADDVIEEFYPEQVAVPPRPKPEDFANRYDPETGEVIDDSNAGDIIAAGDVAADGGTEHFTQWWNSPDVRPHRNDIRHRLEGWRIIATAADQRGGPAPEEAEEDPFGLPPSQPHSPADASEERSGTTRRSAPGLALDEASENLFVPFDPKDPAFFARQMEALIAEAPKDRQRLARIKLANAHGIARLAALREHTPAYDALRRALAGGQ